MLSPLSFRKSFAAFVVTAALTACGGGGGSTGGSVPGPVSPQAQSVGSAKVSYSGNVHPATSSSSYGVTVQGLSGASFNFIDFYPQPTLENTMLLFQRDRALWTYSFLTGQTQQITHFTIGNGALGPGYASWGPNGLILLSYNNSLSQMYADGTHLTPLTTAGVVSVQTTSWDGTRIAGLDASGNLVVMSANGSGIKQLVSAASLNPQNFSCTWMGSSTVGYLDSVNDLYTVPASGGAPVSQHFQFYQSDSIQLCGFSDSVVSLLAAANTKFIYAVGLTPTIATPSITPTNDYDTFPSIAPDNDTVAIYRTHSSGDTNDGYSGIWEESVTGENPRLLVPDPTGSDQIDGSAFDIQWSNYPNYRRFVGTGGSVATASAGFLTSEVGPALSSFFTFTAKTPSTATITPAASTGSEAPLVFSVHADSITQIWYKNGYYLPATTVALSGASDAVVSFDNQYGQIGFVAPALATRGAQSKPRLSIEGSTAVYTGAFSAIYDKTGKNLAAGTVSSISIDSKTGKLLRWK